MGVLGFLAPIVFVGGAVALVPVILTYKAFTTGVRTLKPVLADGILD